MNKQIRVGIIAALLGLLSIGAGALIMNHIVESDKSSVETNPAADAVNSSKLSTLQGDDFDKAFLTQMVEHHIGAVAMAKLVDTEAQDPRIKQLALSIIDSQSKEINDMKNWAESWNIKITDPTQHDIDHMTAQLDGKSGKQLDTAFLSEMIGHHQSAINMSLLALDNANHQELVTLSQQIEATQESEIFLMKDIAQAAGYTLTTTEGHNSDGKSNNHGDDRSDSHSMQ